MQYEPIKNSLGRFFSRSRLMRKIFYFLIDLLLLRAWHVRRVLKKIGPQLPPGASLLDAGSGLGQYSWRLSRMNETWTIKGIDINEGQVEECRNFFAGEGLSRRVSFETGDLTMLGETGLYNMILTVDVMEHIQDDITVFSNFSRALRPGGWLLISTPSDQGGSDVHSDDEHSFIDEHVRDGYSIGDITQKLGEAGFSSVNARYTYGKPGQISWRLSMKYPVRMLNASYLFFILLPFWYMVFFPACIILNILDVSSEHETGTGLIVTARKATL
jgi:SAM-dependent methyltransferase